MLCSLRRDLDDPENVREGSSSGLAERRRKRRGMFGRV